jgi:hypothetical protein
MELAPDFDNPLHCWLTAFGRCRRLGRPMLEVVGMEPGLKAFFEADQGFAQCVERAGGVGSMGTRAV